jgi:hypothetical protein
MQHRDNWSVAREAIMLSFPPKDEQTIDRIFLFISGAWITFFVVLIGMIICTSVHASEHMRIDACQGTRDYRECAIVSIAGEIMASDGPEFVARTQDIRNARVDLQGPGGSLAALIVIGEKVHEKGFRTHVPANSICASACAYIWIAGSVRDTGPNSKLAWHASYDEKAPNVANGRFNALLGMYIAHLGFGYEDVFNMLGNDPRDVHVTLTDAEGVQTRQDIRIQAPQ